MGLDMYLVKKTYVKNWDYMKPEQRHTVTVQGPSASAIQPERVYGIEEEVGYWRKANAIHQWFVTNCQEGVDDCRDAFVTKAQLETLRDLCRSLLNKDMTPETALPTTSGFFFGGTEYDEYYWENVRKTEALLTALLNEDNSHADFYYHSSW
jgi:hypothetical protein